MKKYFYLLAIALIISESSKAAPGDTTWIQANITNLDGYGNYDSMVSFPPASSKTYRKIFMIFTLGKHMCGGSGYCGDWDYTVQNYLMVPGGDTLEIGRLITPYANAGAPRTPWTWQQHYVYDVTEYATVLHGTEGMRIFYSGYSPGFTANIKFAFIEGTPDRTAIDVKKLWGGSFGYGGSTDISTHFPALTKTAPAGTVSSELKFTVTGHGADANGCCEFAPHNYQVNLNGSAVANTRIWRDNCGSNELYPQSGTWIYQRGNWCPGAIVYSNFHTLPGITAGTTYNVDITFDPYTGGGSYTTFGTLIDYGGMNKTLDASIDDIIAPTNDENHFRENPTWGTPVIYVKNTGSAVIDSITFQYGLKDSANMQTYTWFGIINPLEGTQITLPDLIQFDEIAAIDSTTGSWDSGTFVAQIVKVNGVTDNDQTDDTLTSRFASAPKWPSSFRIAMQTNNESIASDTTICETSWIIYDANNTIVAQRTHAKINTQYIDTINFRATGYYRFVVYDSSCDGLEFWANEPPNTPITAGYLYVKKLTGANLPMRDYTYGFGYPPATGYNNDFGCGFSQYFYVVTPDDGIRNITSNGQSMEAFPNPAKNTVNVEFAGLPQVKGEIHIIDALGRLVYQTYCNSSTMRLNTANLQSGVYTILYLDKESGNELQTRLLIMK